MSKHSGFKITDFRPSSIYQLDVVQKTKTTSVIFTA